MLGVFIHEIALRSPRTGHLACISAALASVAGAGGLLKRTFRLIEWPQPAGVNMAMPSGKYKGIGVTVVDLCGVDLVADVSGGDFAAFED